MKRILVVDDYKPFLEEIRQTITDEETIVSTSESSGDAIKQIQERRFDLVITDLFMETKSAADGLAVLKAARAHDSTQVIVITAFGEPQLSKQSMDLGAFDYLDRNAPGVNFRSMLQQKMHLALNYSLAMKQVQPGRI